MLKQHPDMKHLLNGHISDVLIGYSRYLIEQIVMQATARKKRKYNGRDKCKRGSMESQQDRSRDWSGNCE
jgi:hypothetical protein